MLPLSLHDFHLSQGAQFMEVNGAEVVASYGDWRAEYRRLRTSAALLDLSFRSRICLTGADRVRFLHGQVTNDIKRLTFGQGCYAALVNGKGKIESDLNVYALAEELLLDFEPGLAARLTQRLEKYIVADDVQVVDVGPLYGLLSIQGPEGSAAVRGTNLFASVPDKPFECVRADSARGEFYLMNHSRVGTSGFDLFIPTAALAEVAGTFAAALRSVDGGWCGWQALETARIEAGIPRFGPDMDESCFPQECGIEARAVSYAKGCYIGQEVLNRIHTLGHVNRQLCGLRLGRKLPALPRRGDKLYREGKEVGVVTSAAESPTLDQWIALGRVRREANTIGTRLVLRTAEGESEALVVDLPIR